MYPVVTAVAAFLNRYVPDGPVTAAVSGGADSLALAAALAELAAPRTLVVTIDHQLQPTSAAQAQRVCDSAADLGLAAQICPVEVVGSGGMEAAARRARYAALERVRRGPVLLAHTLDDQAETVLLGLGRGSGPRSIAGMQRWRNPWGRPLLGVRRTDTEELCMARGLVPWQDPHNQDPTFQRVRLRHEVIPLLDEVLAGGVVPALARTADLLADDLAALDQMAAGFRTRGPKLSVGGLRDTPRAIRTRVLRRWLLGAGIDELTGQHLTRLDQLLTDGRPLASVRLPGGYDVRCSGAHLVLIAQGRAE